MASLGKISLVLFMFLSFNKAFADVTISAKLENSNVELGDQVVLNIMLISKEYMPNPGPGFSPESVNGLDFLGISSGSSTNMSITNGSTKTEYSKTLTLTYGAIKEGSYKIPRLNVRIKGVPPVGPFRVNIYKKLPSKFKKKAVNKKRGGGFNSLFDSFFNTNRFRGSQPAIKPEFFTEVEVDKSTVYKGEQIFAKWYIYVNGSLSSFDTIKFPTLKGFWKEDVEFASRFRWRTVMKEGKTYKRAVLSSYALIPYKEGDLKIDAFDLRATASGSSFGFSRNSKVFKVKSNTVDIKVLPLPAPVPETYQGGVGTFKLEPMRGASGKKQIFLGEPFKVSFKAVGQESSLKFTEAPELDLGDDFTVYSKEEEYRFFPTKLSSIKEFNYTLIPKKKGVLKLPDLKMSFFSSEDKEYYDVYANFPIFKVVDNPNGNKVKDEDFVEKQIEAEKNEILYFHSSFLGALHRFKISIYLYLGFIFLVILFAFYMFKKTVGAVEEDESLKDLLEEKFKKVTLLYKENNFKSSMDELINLNYLLIGGLSGKRFGTEEEFSEALKSLPSSLKGKKQHFQEINDLAQELRFGTNLSLAENRVKIKECFRKFQDLFLDVKSFLP